jgi:2,4-dienoyl-CoA reductase-like NADH-dependent reductase (Old Yellow Enzyme family)
MSISSIRTTVTLDAEATTLIRQAMVERRLRFKDAINEAVKRAYGRGRAKPFRLNPHRFGFDSSFPWEQAGHLAAQLEDEAIMNTMADDAREDS